MNGSRVKMERSKASAEGILAVDKPPGKTAFSLVSALRRILGVKKIGHAGTLDPFATGVMVMLIGKPYTRLSDSFLNAKKEYIATLKLGEETDTYDCDGVVASRSPYQPTLQEIEDVVSYFQGEIEQTPPMFSAKKQNGKKLYELARKGVTVDRPAVQVSVDTCLVEYDYPLVKLRVRCSKGTYIRSIAHDMGKMLGCGAHLVELRRVRSGDFSTETCFDGSLLFDCDRSCPQLRESVVSALQPKFRGCQESCRGNIS